MSTEKFVTVEKLGRFLTNVKTYVNNADEDIQDELDDVVAAVGDENSGLVKAVADLRNEMNALGGVDGGDGIGGMIDAKIAGLDVVDSEVAGEYVASVSETDGKISVIRKALPVYEAVGAAATAEQNAKDYADGLASNYEVAGEAAKAEAAAKSYTDALANGTVAQHTATLAELTGVGENSINSKVAAAVAGVIDGAPEAFDTLKEVAVWISNNDHASDVAGLVSDVTNLKAIDHTAYVAADETNLQAAKDYADGKFQEKGNFETAGAAAEALEDAKEYANELIANLPLATEADIDALFA